MQAPHFGPRTASTSSNTYIQTPHVSHPPAQISPWCQIAASPVTPPYDTPHPVPRCFLHSPSAAPCTLDPAAAHMPLSLLPSSTIPSHPPTHHPKLHVSNWQFRSFSISTLSPHPARTPTLAPRAPGLYCFSPLVNGYKICICC